MNAPSSPHNQYPRATVPGLTSHMASMVQYRAGEHQWSVRSIIAVRPVSLHRRAAVGHDCGSFRSWKRLFHSLIRSSLIDTLQTVLETAPWRLSSAHLISGVARQALYHDPGCRRHFLTIPRPYLVAKRARLLGALQSILYPRFGGGASAIPPIAHEFMHAKYKRWSIYPLDWREKPYWVLTAVGYGLPLLES